ncbi:MAG: hypothetical protein JJU11_00695 [Candidatus Sumerlaeia bacterium]|nr:hypothetical protein [Candidatus Sumerlaeia bacterium]
MTLAAEKLSVIVLDDFRDEYPDFYRALEKVCHLHRERSATAILDSPCFPSERSVVLLDIESLAQQDDPLIHKLIEMKGRGHVALLASARSADYLGEIVKWGILHVMVKEPRIDEDEVCIFLRCLHNPENGFGLGQYLTRTIEMYRLQVTKKAEKLDVVERITNHFATAGFHIHDLYDVRLILEESLNNSIFHAFRTATGEKKYHPNNFDELDKGERLLIEYGSNGQMAGFTVTDNAGSLEVKTILRKLQKQLDPSGVLTMGGRGLHLSRLLSTLYIINIEPGQRSQVIALFDDRRRVDRVKPFMLNVIGDDDVASWQAYQDFD